MRPRTLWLPIGLVLLAVPTSVRATPPETRGVTAPAAKIEHPDAAAYRQAGHMAVMQEGRVKPLDTHARQVVKQIYGRESIVRRDADGEIVEKWGPVEAFLGWSIRPKEWNARPFILAEYVPLKRLIFQGPIVERLGLVAANEKLAGPVRDQAKALAGRIDWNSAELLNLSKAAGLPDADREALTGFADVLSESHKWLSPDDLEMAEVLVDGAPTPFTSWLASLSEKAAQVGPAGEPVRLPDLERRALEVGERLMLYRLSRDRDYKMRDPLRSFPRPNNALYLTYCANAITAAQKAQEASGRSGLQTLPPLQLDAAKILDKYINELQNEDRNLPGRDPKFDERFAAWLKHNSEWIPQTVILESSAEELTAAGFPAKETEAFRQAFKGFEDAARSSGTNADEAAARLVSTSRALGEALNGDYPTVAALNREVHYNEFAPFFHAPSAYGTGLVLLLLSLVVTGIAPKGRSSVTKHLGSGLYVAGMVSFLAGIALEVYGFYLRVRISGWAPVTNMYETVIWVALVTSVIGLVLELIYRQKYAALAASGIALLATLIAANVSLLDPNIKSLQPVLRDNFWLAIHVLTIVSSYAAFALSMGLGLVATGYYLTATYRRDVGYGELAKPLVFGLPLAILGGVGLYSSYTGTGPAWLSSNGGFYLTSLVAYLGGVPTIMALTGLVGEAWSRSFFRDRLLVGSDRKNPGQTSAESGPASTERPSVSEILNRTESSPTLDARTQAMQDTAARIKPITNFLYRAMQVGVLLIAAGTFLGGWWADKSWGRFWGWDPKEVWALITLLVYLVPLHGRFAGWVNNFGLTVASVCCFSSVLMAWYGVNFVLGVGLHSYGFVEGGSQGLVTAVAMSVMAVVAGAAWRRSLSYRSPASATA